eukprot:3580166-Rhodomonas_salina.2
MEHGTPMPRDTSQRVLWGTGRRKRTQTVALTDELAQREDDAEVNLTTLFQRLTDNLLFELADNLSRAESKGWIQRGRREGRSRRWWSAEGGGVGRLLFVHPLLRLPVNQHVASIACPTQSCMSH